MASTSGDRITTEVLIVGAGPTGLALALSLARAGVSTVLAEKLSAGQNTSRAVVIHAHTLEELEPLGVSEQLLQEGLKLPEFSVCDRDRVLMRIRFDKLPTKYAFLLLVPQDRTENILASALAQAGGAVNWGWEVQALKETSAGVEATIATNEGPVTIQARYVVGADGMRSLVRETAGIGFTGSTYEESFVLADVQMAWGHGSQLMSYISPAGLMLVAPLPQGRYRVVATLDSAPPQPGVADVQALLDTRGPTQGAAKVAEVRWSSRFRIHHRVADHYRRGRFLLVGDAAHVHSPAGGQGMNTGLVDACVLGRLLTDVVQSRNDEAHLDKYEALRRPAAKAVLAMSGRMTRFATLKGLTGSVLRSCVITLVKLPPIEQRWAMGLSGLSRRNFSLGSEK